MVDVVKVTGRGIVDVWPVVSGYINRAIEYSSGRYTEASVLYDLAVGDQTLWLVLDDNGQPVAAATLRVMDYPARRFLNLELIGGDGIDQWLGDIAMATRDYAIEMQCDGMQMLGREGWGKLLAKYGGKKTLSLFELDL